METKNKEKKSTSESSVSGYYTVYDFMVKELGLTGAELLVFALLFSFFKSYGLFRGSWKYIKEKTGVSRTCISRALRLLKERKLIENKSTALEHAYVINPLSKPMIDRLYNSSKLERGQSQNETGVVPNRNGGSSKLEPSNKDEIKECIKGCTVNTRGAREGSAEQKNFEANGIRGDYYRDYYRNCNRDYNRGYNRGYNYQRSGFYRPPEPERRYSSDPMRTPEEWDAYAKMTQERFFAATGGRDD